MRRNQFCSQTKVEDQSRASKVSYGLAIREIIEIRETIESRGIVTP